MLTSARIKSTSTARGGFPPVNKHLMKISRHSPDHHRCRTGFAATWAPVMAIVSTFATLGQLADAETGQPAVVLSQDSHARPLGFGNEHLSDMSDTAEVATRE